MMPHGFLFFLKCVFVRMIGRVLILVLLPYQEETDSLDPCQGYHLAIVSLCHDAQTDSSSVLENWVRVTVSCSIEKIE